MTRDGWCDLHRPARDHGYDEKRPSAAGRGYGRVWQRIRAIVLSRAGIPRERWSEYVVDHRPPFNPAVEPDHMKYELVPMLLKDHSQKTARSDGAFGNTRRSA